MVSKKFDEEYALAKSRLIEEFGENGHNAAAKIFYPILDRGVLADIFSGNDKKTSHLNKQRLVWYYSEGRSHFVYRYIAELMKNDGVVSEYNVKKLKGKYKYYRYYAPKVGSQDTKFDGGEIEITPSGSGLAFSHTSKSHKRKKPGPEHTGPVFISGQYMFMLGTREDVLRLSICDILQTDRNYMKGLVLSVRSEIPNDPFAARFVIVPEHNQILIEELEDMSPITVLKDGKNISTTRGEEKFFQLTQGDYAYFMLSLHNEG